MTLMFPGQGTGAQRPQGPDHRGGGGGERRQWSAPHHQERAAQEARALPRGGQQQVLHRGRQGLHLQGDLLDRGCISKVTH